MHREFLCPRSVPESSIQREIEDRRVKSPAVRIVYWLNRLRWRLTRPLTVGVRLLAIRNAQVLLVQHTYTQGWYLPGGGVQKGESLDDAMRREVTEEIGATLHDLRLFGVYSNFFEYKNDHIVVFVCQNFILSGDNDHEIAQWDVFPVTSLPAETSPGTRRRIAEFMSQKTGIVEQW